MSEPLSCRGTNDASTCSAANPSPGCPTVADAKGEISIATSLDDPRPPDFKQPSSPLANSPLADSARAAARVLANWQDQTANESFGTGASGDIPWHHYPENTPHSASPPGVGYGSGVEYCRYEYHRHQYTESHPPLYSSTIADERLLALLDCAASLAPNSPAGGAIPHSDTLSQPRESPDYQYHRRYDYQHGDRAAAAISPDDTLIVQPGHHHLRSSAAYAPRLARSSGFEADGPDRVGKRATDDPRNWRPQLASQRSPPHERDGQENWPALSKRQKRDGPFHSCLPSPTPSRGAKGARKDIRRVARRWSDEETEALIKGCIKHGVGAWKRILDDPEFVFNDRTSVDLKDRLVPARPSILVRMNVAMPSVLFRTIRAQECAQLGESRSGSRSCGTLRRVSDVVWPLPENSQRLQGLQRVQRKPTRSYTPEEDILLLLGVYKHGNHWARIAGDQRLRLSSRPGQSLRDRLRNAFPKVFLAFGYSIPNRGKDSDQLLPRQKHYKDHPLVPKTVPGKIPDAVLNEINSYLKEKGYTFESAWDDVVVDRKADPQPEKPKPSSSSSSNHYYCDSGHDDSGRGDGKDGTMNSKNTADEAHDNGPGEPSSEGTSQEFATAIHAVMTLASTASPRAGPASPVPVESDADADEGGPTVVSSVATHRLQAKSDSAVLVDYSRPLSDNIGVNGSVGAAALSPGGDHTEGLISSNPDCPQTISPASLQRSPDGDRDAAKDKVFYISMATTADEAQAAEFYRRPSMPVLHSHNPAAYADVMQAMATLEDAPVTATLPAHPCPQGRNRPHRSHTISGVGGERSKGIRPTGDVINSSQVASLLPQLLETHQACAPENSITKSKADGNSASSITERRRDGPLVLTWKEQQRTATHARRASYVGSGLINYHFHTLHRPEPLPPPRTPCGDYSNLMLSQLFDPERLTLAGAPLTAPLTSTNECHFPPLIPQRPFSAVGTVNPTLTNIFPRGVDSVSQSHTSKSEDGDDSDGNSSGGDRLSAEVKSAVASATVLTPDGDGDLGIGSQELQPIIPATAPPIVDPLPTSLEDYKLISYGGSEDELFGGMFTPGSLAGNESAAAAAAESFVARQQKSVDISDGNGATPAPKSE
ncbi:hypothetical protein EV182_000375 [Spiromyces aspiralis]|uniref:Uncharacterized protein n=1 Tax=Spiromyces aspiralis TaxID=68401 RepID=A0ACC1HH36_9FUNG|nr:hypothetical protein EV182_000375 [Spiromyces aspiralis]